MEVVLISCNSTAGHELAQQLRRLTTELGLTFYIEEEIRGREHYARLCLESDAVIVDVTMSEGFLELYQYIDPQVHLHNVLLVSRTYTPLNVFNVWGGGTTPFPYLEGEQESLSNEEIVEYVRGHLIRIQDIDPATYEQNESGNPTADSVLNSWDYIRRLAQSYYHIFISYRSSRYGEVLKIKKKLEGTLHEQTQKPIKVILFKPGELAFENELLSAMRKWQILGALEEQVAKCDELWIIESPHYYNSWWTTGELFAVSYLNYLLEIGEGVRTKPIKVRRYYAQADTLSEEVHLNPNFNEGLRRRIAQHTTHTSLYEVGIGYQNKIRNAGLKRAYRNLSRIGLGWALRKGVTKFQQMMIKRVIRQLPIEEREEVLEKYGLHQPLKVSREQFELVLNDFRWTDEFWFHLLLPTRTHDFLKVENDGEVIELDAEAFVAFQNESLYQSYPPAELSRLIKEQAGQLQLEGRTFSVQKVPYRFFLHKGASTSHLIPVPTYTAQVLE